MRKLLGIFIMTLISLCLFSCHDRSKWKDVDIVGDTCSLYDTYVSDDGVVLTIGTDEVYLTQTTDDVDGMSIYQLNVLNDSVMLWLDEINYIDSVEYHLYGDTLYIRYASECDNNKELYMFMRVHND